MEPERTAASLAMQSHHILFWSCRLRLSTLFPARRHDLLLDAIQTKNLIPLSTSLPMTPSPRRRQEPLLPFITPLTFPGDGDGASGGSRHHPAYFFSFFLSKLSLLTASVDIVSAHANDEERGVGRAFGFSPPASSSFSSLIIFFLPGCRRSGLSSRNTVRNPGHGVSLGKQRPGQQGFADYSEISGGSSTLLDLLFLTVHSFLTQLIYFLC